MREADIRMTDALMEGIKSGWLLRDLGSDTVRKETDEYKQKCYKVVYRQSGRWNNWIPLSMDNKTLKRLMFFEKNYEHIHRNQLLDHPVARKRLRQVLPTKHHATSRRVKPLIL